MKKSVAIGIFAAMSALVIGVGAYAWSLDSRLENAGRVTSAYGGSAMGEFTGALSELNEAMSESMYATNSALVSTLCAKAAANAASAVTALSSLPYSTQELEVLSQYLNGAGDYALYLAAQAAEGRTLTAQELENLTALGEAVREISVQAGGIFDALDAGELTMDEYGATGDAAVSGTVGYELSALDAALDDFPELEYAGRYSKSVMSPEAAYIKDRKAVSELDARRIAAEFLGVDESELTDAGRSEGAYGVYAFTQELENGQQRYITVTEQGGVVETVSGACTLGGAQTAAEDAEALALEMLGGAFGEEFTRVEMREQTGLYGFTFAPVVDGVALLPDTVEVSVDSATGEVCTWNAHNYIMYHAPRAAMTADVDMETAKSAVPESLSILGARLALTRSDGGVETLCWEFACQNAAGGGVNVFVDAKTGRQAKIELTN